MGISSEFAEDVGKFLRNLKSPRWYGVEVAKQALYITVFDSKTGKEVRAWIKGHLYNHERDKDGNLIKTHHQADAYQTDTGVEILHVNNQKFVRDNKGNFIKI